jgi:hypothetical protein
MTSCSLLDDNASDSALLCIPDLLRRRDLLIARCLSLSMVFCSLFDTSVLYSTSCVMAISRDADIASLLKVSLSLSGELLTFSMLVFLIAPRV